MIEHNKVSQYGRIHHEQNGSLCVGAMIEEASAPGCRVWQAGDSSGCETCGARWDTNEEPGNWPPKCGLSLDPLRGGLLT